MTYMSKLLKIGCIFAIILTAVFTLLGLGLLVIAILCDKKYLLTYSSLAADLFKGIGIGIAFFGVSYFIEKSKEDYVKKNESLLSVIHSERYLQEAYKNYSSKDCHYDHSVYVNFLDYMTDKNPMFINGLSGNARVVAKNGNGIEIPYPPKPQGIDIHSLFFLNIKDIQFIVFNNKKKEYLSDIDTSRIKDAGVFKIEFFSGARFVYCPKLNKTEIFDTDEEFKKYCISFEKSDTPDSYHRMNSGVANTIARCSGTPCDG